MMLNSNTSRSNFVMNLLTNYDFHDIVIDVKHQQIITTVPKLVEMSNDVINTFDLITKLHNAELHGKDVKCVIGDQCDFDIIGDDFMMKISNDSMHNLYEMFRHSDEDCVISSDDYRYYLLKSVIENGSKLCWIKKIFASSRTDIARFIDLRNVVYIVVNKSGSKFLAFAKGIKVSFCYDGIYIINAELEVYFKEYDGLSISIVKDHRTYSYESTSKPYRLYYDKLCDALVDTHNQKNLEYVFKHIKNRTYRSIDDLCSNIKILDCQYAVSKHDPEYKIYKALFDNTK